MIAPRQCPLSPVAAPARLEITSHFVIGGLVVVAVVIGHLLSQERQKTSDIDVGKSGISVETN
jgi:hypothetical protein